MPKVSVIMPCFNHARFLEESVQAIVRQTYSDWELIIVDDCSADNSWEVMSALARKDSRITVIRHERNLGASKSRNQGMRAAKGEFLGFCDSDDIWEPEKLDVQLKALMNNPECDVTYCDAFIIDESGNPWGTRFSEEFPLPGNRSGNLYDRLVLGNFINMQTVLMRRSCMEKSGFFDEKIKWIEDWWYWVKVSRHHRFVYVPESLAKYRVHSKSTGYTQKRGQMVNRFKVFKRILRMESGLPQANHARVLYNMGVELCTLGKKRMGRRLFWAAASLAITDMRAFNTFWKALATVLSARTIPVTAVHRALRPRKVESSDVKPVS